MNQQAKIHSYSDGDKVVTRLRDDLHSGGKDSVLVYAYNGIGKTRMSMAFKNAGKAKNDGDPDTLYFNAYTEDLFSWDNDLENDSEPFLTLNVGSSFLAGLNDYEMDTRIRPLLQRHADFDFRIDSEFDDDRNLTQAAVRFFRSTDLTDEEAQPIKVSRGEENLFIWCFFLAIVELVLDEDMDAYNWVKFVYIDDPISSLDENNAIAVGHDLADLIRRGKNRVKFVVSSHHSLFFNVVCNELKKSKVQRYFLHRPDNGSVYTLRKTNETPFFHHVAMLSEIQRAAESGELYTFHFNILRNVMEKTAVFFGHHDFSTCLSGIEDEGLYARALNLLSHGNYSLYEPREMVQDNKDLFNDILAAFLDKHTFDLPAILAETSTANA
ncbi:AAA family ATPase [Rhodopirellula baltica]